MKHACFLKRSFGFLISSFAHSFIPLNEGNEWITHKPADSIQKMSRSLLELCKERYRCESQKGGFEVRIRCQLQEALQTVLLIQSQEPQTLESLKEIIHLTLGQLDLWIGEASKKQKKSA